MAKKKNQLSADAKALRKALYPSGTSLDFPSSAKKEAVREAILKLPGNSWYNSHRHLTWCSGKEKAIQQANKKLVQSKTPAIECFLRIQMTHTPDPPFSVLRQWAAANGVGVSIVADILNTMMPAPMMHPGPAHEGGSNLSQTAASLHMASAGPPLPEATSSGLIAAEQSWSPNTWAHEPDGYNAAFDGYEDGSTAWSTVGEDNAKSPWSATEGGALPAHQYTPDASYFYAGDEY